MAAWPLIAHHPNLPPRLRKYRISYAKSLILTWRAGFITAEVTELVKPFRQSLRAFRQSPMVTCTLGTLKAFALILAWLQITSSSLAMRAAICA
jgi:hypothetical protein